MLTAKAEMTQTRVQHFKVSPLDYRLSKEQFASLLSRVGPSITKSQRNYRKSISQTKQSISI